MSENPVPGSGGRYIRKPDGSLKPAAKPVSKPAAKPAAKSAKKEI